MKVPAVGDDIYVPTISNYFVGGLAKVIGVVGDGPHHILVKEHEGANYRWEGGIAEMQDELKSQFGEQVAYSTGIKRPCPLKS